MENKKKETNAKQESKKELCVLCWKETIYTKDTPIHQRKCYVEAVGQLCEKCWQEIYGNKK